MDLYEIMISYNHSDVICIQDFNLQKKENLITFFLK